MKYLKQMLVISMFVGALSLHAMDTESFARKAVAEKFLAETDARITRVTERIARETGSKEVVLSGGPLAGVIYLNPEQQALLKREEKEEAELQELEQELEDIKRLLANGKEAINADRGAYFQEELECKREHQEFLAYQFHLKATREELESLIKQLKEASLKPEQSEKTN